MALQLARSFEYWNSNNDIGFIILTDRDEVVPKSLKKTQIQKVEAGELGVGFSAKLYIDRYTSSDRTLFIDADCFVLGDLERVFDRFLGRPVSVVGGTIKSGDWFGDVATICRLTGVQKLPKFNGGIYYIERGLKSTAVFERARKLEAVYDDLGLLRLRGLPNDELLMAIAMAQEDCWGIPEDGTIMGDLMSTPHVDYLNVLSGSCILQNPDPSDPRHANWFPLREIRPMVVHFLGSHVSSWRYRRQALQLRLAFDHQVPRTLAEAIGFTYTIPALVTDYCRNKFRPLYRRIFGIRKIRGDFR